MKTIILRWYGAYEYDEIWKVGDWGNGIYLITGKKVYERASKIQYCGITERSFKDRLRSHHKTSQVTRDLKFWLSEVEYPKRFNRGMLEMAEKIIIYAWQYQLNERKKVMPPQPTTIINYWFKKDDLPRFNQLEIYRHFSDVLSWDGAHWRTGNLKVEQD
jgi:hypothetical protein